MISPPFWGLGGGRSRALIQMKVSSHCISMSLRNVSTSGLENIQINIEIKPGLGCHTVALVALTCLQLLRLCNGHCEYLVDSLFRRENRRALKIFTELRMITQMEVTTRQ